MKVYLTDEVYRRDDGIRDPFRWTRFTGSKFVLGALLFGLVLLLAGGQDPAARARGKGIERASGVIGAAARIVEQASRGTDRHMDI